MLIYQVIELEKNIVNHQCTIYLQNTCNRLTHDERMIKFSSKNLQCRRHSQQFSFAKSVSTRLFRLTQADVAFDTSKISYSKQAGFFEGAVKHETKVRLKHARPQCLPPRASCNQTGREEQLWIPAPIQLLISL